MEDDALILLIPLMIQNYPESNSASHYSSSLLDSFLITILFLLKTSGWTKPHTS